MKEREIYIEKLKKLLFLCIIYLIIFILCECFVWGRNMEFFGGDVVMVVIFSIVVHFYAKLKKKDYFYLYIIMIITITVDHFINWLLVTYDKEILTYYEASVLYKLILLICIYYHDKLPKFLSKYKKTSVLVTTLIGIFSILNGNHIGYAFRLPNWFYLLNNITILVIVVALLIRAIKEKDFIDTVFIISLIFIILGRVILMLGFKNIMLSDCQRYYNKQAFFLALFVLFIGFTVEFRHLYEINIKLNNDVHAITNDMEMILDMKIKQSNFFTNLAHELKTPLNIIFSCIQFLDAKEKDEICDYYYKYNNTLKQNCYRMIRLINNLIDVKKLELGNLKVDFHNYEIVSLIEEITMSIIPYVSNNNIEIIFDTYVEELEIKCDAEKIERVMLNLLSNSIKYTPNNGRIMVLMDRTEENVIIKVIDTGTGIPADKQKSVFDLFVQGDTSLARLKEGSGIGLALAKSMIKLHNGRIFIENSSAEGTTITVELPITVMDEPSCINKSYDFNANNIIDKINIEFSDIYDIQ